MQSKVSKLDTKKSGTRLSKSGKDLLSDQMISSENEIDRQRMIAVAAYYRAEKRGFTDNEADAVQNWLEAEMEIGNV